MLKAATVGVTSATRLSPLTRIASPPLGGVLRHRRQLEGDLFVFLATLPHVRADRMLAHYACCKVAQHRVGVAVEGCGVVWWRVQKRATGARPTVSTWSTKDRRMLNWRRHAVVVAKPWAEVVWVIVVVAALFIYGALPRRVAAWRVARRTAPCDRNSGRTNAAGHNDNDIVGHIISQAGSAEWAAVAFPDARVAQRMAAPSCYTQLWHVSHLYTEAESALWKLGIAVACVCVPFSNGGFQSLNLACAPMLVRVIMSNNAHVIALR